jgi:hypothetical protein
MGLRRSTTAREVDSLSPILICFNILIFQLNWTELNWTELSESYVTTDGQSASLSWHKAPMWGLRPDFYYCQIVAGLLMWDAPLTRGRVYCLQLLLVLASSVILGTESCGTRDRILLSQIWGSPFRRLLRLAGLQWRYSIRSRLNAGLNWTY